MKRGSSSLCVWLAMSRHHGRRCLIVGGVRPTKLRTAFDERSIRSTRAGALPSERMCALRCSCCHAHALRVWQVEGPWHLRSRLS